jgi:hypothetical protein
VLNLAFKRLAFGTFAGDPTQEVESLVAENATSLNKECVIFNAV